MRKGKNMWLNIPQDIHIDQLHAQTIFENINKFNLSETYTNTEIDYISMCTLAIIDNKIKSLNSGYNVFDMTINAAYKSHYYNISLKIIESLELDKMDLFNFSEFKLNTDELILCRHKVLRSLKNKVENAFISCHSYERYYTRNSI